MLYLDRKVLCLKCNRLTNCRQNRPRLLNERRRHDEQQLFRIMATEALADPIKAQDVLAKLSGSFPMDEAVVEGVL